MNEKRTATLKGIPRVVTPDEVQKGISIPNPAKEEGERREYISKEVANGWKDQLFTSNEYPERIPVIYTGKMEEDPGNGEEHPLFVIPIITKPFEIYGRAGWFVWREFSKIPRKLLSQKGVANIRCAEESDFEFIEVPNGRFWLSSPTFSNDINGRTHFLMRYMNNGRIGTCDLYRQDGEEYGGNTGCGILAAVSLNIQIRDKSEKARGLWN